MNFYFKPLSVSLARGFDATCFPYLIHVSRILKVPTRKAEFFFAKQFSKVDRRLASPEDGQEVRQGRAGAQFPDPASL